MIKNVILDAGHGGLDSNGKYTTAPSKMFKFPNGEVAYEGHINRQITAHLLTYLKNHTNINTVCTVDPNDSRDLSLGWRVRVANKFNSKETIFISIHCNAGGGTGFEIFTTKGTTASDILAEKIAIQAEYAYKEVSLKLRYDFSDKDRDKEEDFYVLKNTNCPAVLLEVLFFDNAADFAILKDSKFQAKIAYRIYLGILDFIYN